LTRAKGCGLYLNGWIKTEKNNVLFSGCSHKGIENIVDRLSKRDNISFSHVIGGFHMSHFDPEDLVQTTYLEGLGQKLSKSKSGKILFLPLHRGYCICSFEASNENKN